MLPCSVPTNLLSGSSNNVVGIPFSSNFRITSARGSLADLSSGKLIFSKNGIKTLAPPLSIEIKRILNCWLLILCCNLNREGNSLTQGAHQVAQKLTRVQVPLN